MKRKTNFVLRLALALIICAAAISMAACGDPSATVGEGGIVPEGGYKRIDVENSCFYVPSDSVHSGKQNGLDVYSFSDGTFNVNVVEVSMKIQRLSRSSFNKALKQQYKGSGITYSIDEYKFYKLSDLWILADELTITDGSTGKVIKEYQFSYNTGNKQVTVTIAYNDVDVAAEADFPAKLLYSIALC